MKKKCIVELFFFIIMTMSLIGCKKETSCEGCAGNKENKPPIAVAGPDQLITLPTDSVLLDGRTSSDPDGSIRNYLWTKISGPSSFIIITPSDSITKVKTLVSGTYRFELKVTDNDGLSAKDTMNVIATNAVITNHPPIASAGPDQTITLPANVTNLDGSSSTDPDNNITNYVWSKISGPSTFIIANPNTSQTQITNLTEGIYQLELKVTDAGGLFSKDTVKISVQSITPPPIPACNISNRPIVTAQLIPIGTLSQTRGGMAVTSTNNKIFFAGGYSVSNGYTTRVDIFDITTNTWSMAELSEARTGITSVNYGTKVFFGGGGDYNSGNMSSKVDIYDASSNTWSANNLSLARTSMAGAAINNQVFFAGGAYQVSPYLDVTFTNRVDVFDILSNTWTTASLNEPRGELTADVSGNKIYFAGGTNQLNIVNDYTSSSTIDVYDANLNTWSNISPLSEPKGLHAAAALNGKVYWAGGRSVLAYYQSNYNMSPLVEIRDPNTQSSSFECLFQPNAQFKSAVKDNKIIFFTGAGQESNKFDIYNTLTNSWSIGVLDKTIIDASIISVNNTIYVAGGYVNGVLSNQVWKLEF